MNLIIILVASVLGLVLGIASLSAPVWSEWRKQQRYASTGAEEANTSYDESLAA